VNKKILKNSNILCKGMGEKEKHILRLMKFRPQRWEPKPKRSFGKRKRIPPKTMQIKFNGKYITIFRFWVFLRRPLLPLCFVYGQGQDKYLYIKFGAMH